MCEKQISTKNGILTCDKKAGHTGMHHAKHRGGSVPYTDHRKIPNTEEFAMTTRPPLEIEWPQEGMNDPVKIREG